MIEIILLFEVTIEKEKKKENNIPKAIKKNLSYMAGVSHRE